MMKRHWTTQSIGVFALAVAFAAAGSAAQQPAAAPAAKMPQAAAKGHQVTVAVTVRDKHGALVSSLDKSDLSLTDNGHPQVIQEFTRESRLPFQVGLLVDTSHSAMGAIEDVRKAADKFVDQMLPAEAKAGAAESSAATGGDEMFLIHFDREVELLRDFTASREKLHTELDEMGPTSRTQDDREGPETTGDNRQRPRAGETTQLYDAIFLASDELMKPKTGRKALVVYSDGVDLGSKETMNEALDAAERAHVVIYTIYLKGDQGRENPFPNNGRRGGLGGGYPGGGYPGGYPGGGYPGGGAPSGGRQPQTDGRKTLEQIATRTGGLYFDARRKQDMEEIYGLIAQDLRGQYLMTYTPEKLEEDGSFHKIALKTEKKDLTIVAPEGYFAPGGDSK
ncbi:MAG: VWA domain-containing protein [Acidobacteriota bacterium]|nr:VWA domain-containing protein [Acidobacteriota bacterium]